MGYLLDGTFIMRNGNIDKYLFDGGYAQATTGAYTDSFAFYYYSKDHLGNVRSVMTKNPATNYDRLVS